MKFDIGLSIKNLRQEFNMSQKDLSKLLKIPQSKLSKMELNELNYDSVYIILDICSTFDISIADFFGEVSGSSIKYNPFIKKLSDLTDQQLKLLVEFIESLYEKK